MTPGKLTGSLALIATAFLWGTPIPIIGEMTDRWDPIHLGFVRYLIALPVSFLIASYVLGWRLPPLRPDGISTLKIAFLGGFGLAMFAVIFVYALAFMNPATAAVIAAMAPITSSLVAIFYGEKPDKSLGIGVALAVVGAIFAACDLSSLRSEEEELFDLQGGEPLFLFAQILWAWYSITCRRAMPTSHPAVVTFATMVPAAFTLVTVTLVLDGLGWLRPWPDNDTTFDWVAIVWMGIGSLALAVLGWNIGVASLGLVVSSIHMNLIPIVVVLTVFVMGIEPKWEELVGGAVVIAGVIQAQYASWSRMKQRQAAAAAAALRGASSD